MHFLKYEKFCIPKPKVRHDQLPIQTVSQQTEKLSFRSGTFDSLAFGFAVHAGNFPVVIWHKDSGAISSPQGQASVGHSSIKDALDCVHWHT
jgi:hypothetical protein